MEALRLGSDLSPAWHFLAMQVVAGSLAPITALVQNLIMSALFQPFEALCSEATAEIDEVNAHATSCMHCE